MITDCRWLSFINRYANSNSKISRWDILIRSFNVIIRFNPNTEGIIRITDLFTRNSIQGVNKNKRIKKSEINKFLELDFSGLPDLEIHDAMALITKVHKLLAKYPISGDSLRRVKNYFISLIETPYSYKLYKEAVKHDLEEALLRYCCFEKFSITTIWQFFLTKNCCKLVF